MRHDYVRYARAELTKDSKCFARGRGGFHAQNLLRIGLRGETIFADSDGFRHCGLRGKADDPFDQPFHRLRKVFVEVNCPVGRVSIDSLASREGRNFGLPRQGGWAVFYPIELPGESLGL